MTIDGFLQFLGLIVAVYALLNVVDRYRFRLFGWWLWVPTICALLLSIYFLLFDVVGQDCNGNWCKPLEVPPNTDLTPKILAFVIVLFWIAYVATLSKITYLSARNFPLLAALVDRLVSERRFAEVIEFMNPHAPLLFKVAGRDNRIRHWRDRIRFHGNPFFRPELLVSASEAGPESRLQALWGGVVGRVMRTLKRLEAKLPETSSKEQAAQRLLRVLHTHEPLVEFIALERPLVALKLMQSRNYDHDFSDRAFEYMMANPQSSLRQETLLNQNTGLCFYEIDAKNALIFALFADTRVAEKLEVYRPVGNYPLGLLDRNEDNYRNTVSSSKPRDDRLIGRDPTFCMIRFFDIMVRSAMRDGIEWHMWLLYYDLLVRKLVSSIDFTDPEFDRNIEFPNFAYYLIYEVFSAYKSWLQAIECCPENSAAVRIQSVAPRHDNGSILKTTILSIGNSLRHLLESDGTPDRVITYFLEMMLREYRELAGRKNGGSQVQEALLNSIISGGVGSLEPIHVARLRDCYHAMDHIIRFETPVFGDAIEAALR